MILFSLRIQKNILYQNLSTREIERILSVSKNTVAFIKREFDKCDKDWEEYYAECKKNVVKHCCYTTFTTGYKKYLNSKNFTSHVYHKPGITIEVDWAGSTMKYIDPDTGKEVIAYLFVATLPYSQYTYVEPTLDMKSDTWLRCHINMFEYFGGTTIRLICDNL